jgi:hypothetical protein
VFRRTGVRSQQELLDRIALASASLQRRTPMGLRSAIRQTTRTSISATTALYTPVIWTTAPSGSFTWNPN